jgi:hypothetical protein
MRHPPRSVLLAVAGTAALVAGALSPVVTAQGAAPARTVEYTVTGQWDTGFQGAVRITDNAADMSGWSLAFDFTGGQKVTRGWNAEWSRSGATVTAVNESWNGSLGAGASVSVGLIASKSGVNAVPAAFRPGGTACDPGNGPTPTPTSTPTPTATSTPTPTAPPSTDPPGTGGEPPALHVSGNELVDGAGKTRRLLGVNRSGGEFMCVRGRGIWESCWNSTLAPVAARVPPVAGEIGENTCSHGFVDRVMKWFDDRGLSYPGWTWNAWDCSTGPSLISAYDGTPTAYGIGLRDHLRALDG